MSLINEARAVYDDAVAAKRGVTAEEQQKVDRIDARVSEIESQVSAVDQREQRERESAVAREAFDRQHPGTSDAPVSRDDSRQALYEWMRGSARHHEDRDEPGKNAVRIDMRRARREVEAIRSGASAEELRALLWDTGSSASLVPTDLARDLYQAMTASVALMRMPTTKITTPSGNPIDFPRAGTDGAATAVIAQGTTIGGTDPTFSRMRLDAFKRGQIVQLAAETIQDSGVGIVEFVVNDIGRTVGELVATEFAVGTGSGQPNGVMTAIGGAGTIVTGGTLIDPTPEKLIDLVYSVNGNYRARSSAAWLMRDLTAANIRKLRDGAGGTVGAFIWQPSLTEGIQGGEPGLLLGYPVWTDPNIASLASNAKVIAFGDFSAFYIRQVDDFVVERSDDVAFKEDLVTFRGKTRVDSDLRDSTAINIIKRSV